MIKLKDGFRGERAVVLPPAIVEMIEKHPYTASLHITDIGYYPKAAYHYRERCEPINTFVLIYCVDGAGWFKVAGGEKHAVSRGQYFVLPAGTPHAYASDERQPWTIYWVHFKGTQASLYAHPLAQPVTISMAQDSRMMERNNLFDEIMQTLEMGYSIQNLAYASSVLNHYLATFCFLGAYRNAKVGNGQKPEPSAIDMAIHFMKENVERHMQTADVASHVGYSVSHFSKQFQKETGYTPIAYFNHMKIQYACQLLDFSDLKINQICFKIGIEDCYYFSRLFHKIMGMPPQAYRKQQKG